MKISRLTLAAMVCGVAVYATPAAQSRVIHVPLEYRAPGEGPKPNFSPTGTKVALTPDDAEDTLPAGASRPARIGTIQIGPDVQAWIRLLVTADPDHPKDLCRLYLDRNRNGNFGDDGPPVTAVPSQNAKTEAWWSSFNKVELSIRYGAPGNTEPYLVNFWAVRDGDAPPDVIRYSVGSWRYGTVTIDGTPALVAAMDANNDAVFNRADNWSVLEAAAPDAEKSVLSHTEARSTMRLMFVKREGAEQVLEFRSFSPDGRSVDFAIVDRPVTKAEDRAPDDTLAGERSRPRTTTPMTWAHGAAGLTTALAQAKRDSRRVFLDFETTWCGPCKSMDDWIWTDAEVAAQLNAAYVGVKLDGDIEKALVKRHTVKGYPTIIVLDAGGAEISRALGYLSSKQLLTFLGSGTR
jgi:thiol-disulfide isomerase/thioredoxin